MVSTGPLAQLRQILKPKDIVYTIVTHVSRSGMTRHVKVLIEHEGTIRCISSQVAKIIGARQSKNADVVVKGCGMDVGFEIVYNLGRKMFPDGFKTTAWGSFCPSCFNSLDWEHDKCPACNKETRPAYVRNTPLTYDPDGGYAFQHTGL